MIILGIAITIIGSMLVGCGEKQIEEKEAKQAVVVMEKENEPVINQEQSVTLRTASQFGGIDPAKDTYEARLNQFKSENPNITVEDESGEAGEVWKAKMTTDFLANNEADVIYTFIGKDMKNVIEQGKVVSIGEIQKEYPQYGNNILENVLESVEELDGNTYAIPIRGRYEGLFVNKAIFKEYELELPTDWKKLETAIIALNAKGKVPITAALGDTPHHWVENLILSQGGVEVHKNADIKAIKKHWIKGLEYLKTLYDLGAFPMDTNIISNERAIELFINGEAAMLLEGSEVTSQFQSLDEIAVLPFPTVPGGKKDPGDIISAFEAGWYITKKAWDDPARRGAAVQFVEQMTSTETIVDFIRLGDIPTADIGESKGLLADAKNLSRPLHSWLPASVWNELISQISDIVISQEEATPK